MYDRLNRWTERELESEIANLGDRLARAAEGGDRRARCAVSFLRQVLQERRDELNALRARNRRGVH
ncbi:MAG: hypothetical protein H6983_06920 [Ectothiorhodospiraceae bacterium]|nr:hypothetical protein [Chromatiales bacterium]MCP5153878.1 hypothetical protein [Ectothiorhodospiraceae bacterium]